MVCKSQTRSGEHRGPNFTSAAGRTYFSQNQTRSPVNNGAQNSPTHLSEHMIHAFRLSVDGVCVCACGGLYGTAGCPCDPCVRTWDSTARPDAHVSRFMSASVRVDECVVWERVLRALRHGWMPICMRVCVSANLCSCNMGQPSRF